jgi:exonuclease III
MISGDLDVTLACAHLPSKRDSAPSTRLDAAQRFGRAVRQLQKQVGHHRTILLGDLNMNPFEDGVSAASGLHGVMTKEIAQRRARTVGGEESSILYNPMWNRFTDRTPGPAGTYFRAGSDDVEYFWNTYDQVLIGADLLDCFDDDSLVVVTKLGNMRLAGANGRPDASKASDHFPITFSIDI